MQVTRDLRPRETHNHEQPTDDLQLDLRRAEHGRGAAEHDSQTDREMDGTILAERAPPSVAG